MKHLSALIFILISSSVCAKEEIKAWTYYDFPPFSVDIKAETGLSFDLVSYLNRKLDSDELEFQLEYLPRPRLNEKLAHDQSGIVVWPIPVWFGDGDQTRYIWTNYLLSDQNDVLSHVNNPIEYNGPESLIGHKFGGVYGHEIPGIQPLCESETLECEFIYKEEFNLMKLAGQRIDVTVMASTAKSYILKDSAQKDLIHFSVKPHSEYLRRILITKDLAHLEQPLNRIIANMPEDAEWQSILATYGLSTQ